jgi:hypothetical protein
MIQSELLEVLYTFLDSSRITFIFLTNQVSFIPHTILNQVKIVRSKSQSCSVYDKSYESRVDELVEYMVSDKEYSIMDWRDKTYQLLVWNDSIHDAFAYFIERLIAKEYINTEHLSLLFSKYYEIIYLFNNNYRTIYHLERFIIFLRNLKESPHNIT